MSCPDELCLSMLADGELQGESAAEVTAHLEKCRACRAHYGALEVENAALVAALRETELREIEAARENLPRQENAGWRLQAAGAFVVAAVATIMAGEALSFLAGVLGWLASQGGVEGLVSIALGLLDLFIGGEGMWSSVAAFAVTVAVGMVLTGLPALRRRVALGIGAGAAWALLVVLAVPVPALAIEVRTEKGGTVRVAAGEVLADDVLLSGRTALVEGSVEGDVIVMAERVEITGAVGGNIYGGGQIVSIRGEVSGNVHLIGQDVELNAKTAGSGFLLGQHVTLAQGGELGRNGYLAGESVHVKGRVGRGLVIAGERVHIEGRIGASTRSYAKHFTLAANGTIGNDLVVVAPSEEVVEIDEQARIGGETSIEVKACERKNKFLRPGFYLGFLARVIALLLAGFVIVTLFPSLLPQLPDSSLDVLRKMGFGFVALVATPAAILLAAITVIGIPIAVLAGMAYVVVAYLATWVVASFAGRKLSASEDAGWLLTTALSLVVIMAVAEVPLIGAGWSFLVHLLGVGCILVHLKNQYRASRARSEA